MISERSLLIDSSDAAQLCASMRTMDRCVDMVVGFVYENALAHGWHEEERSIGDIIALCHSELSEAAEAFEDDRISTKLPDTLETVEEFADVVIRIMDWFGKCGMSLNATVFSMPHLYVSEVRVGVEVAGGNFYKQISDMHCDLSAALDAARDGDTVKVFRYLAVCLLRIMEYSQRCGLAVEEAVIAKHNYNVGREYRHGGKKF